MLFSIQFYNEDSTLLDESLLQLLISRQRKKCISALKIYWTVYLLQFVIYVHIFVITTFTLIFVAAFSQRILRSVSQTQLTWATSSRSTSASFKCKHNQNINPSIYQSTWSGANCFKSMWNKHLWDYLFVCSNVKSN